MRMQPDHSDQTANAQMASGASVELHNTSETVRDSLFFPEPYLSLKAWTCKQTKRELCVFMLETHIFRSKSGKIKIQCFYSIRIKVRSLFFAYVTTDKILVWTICY
ncbi:unnamed protein product [Brassica oleracea]